MSEYTWGRFNSAAFDEAMDEYRRLSNEMRESEPEDFCDCNGCNPLITPQNKVGFVCPKGKSRA
jgi:hypothetical protein